MEEIEVLWITLNGILIFYTIILCISARNKIMKEKVI